VAEAVRSIGSEHGLRFEIAESAHEVRWPGLAWLELTAWIGPHKVWCQTDGDREGPVSWTWVDLLAGLARAWPWLLLEEGSPLPLEITTPNQLRSEAEARWARYPRAVAEREEEELFGFMMNHDLARFLRGIYLPTLWVERVGKEYMLWSLEFDAPVMRPAAEVVGCLEALGDSLAEHLAPSTEARAVQAAAQWQGRMQRVNETTLTYATGLSASEIEQLAGDESPAEFFSCDTDDTDPVTRLEQSELLAVARMTKGVAWRSRAIILGHIKELHKSDTPLLDEWVSRLPALDRYGTLAYQQGYELARRLRTVCACTTGPVDIEALMRELGVTLKEIQLPEATGVDAIAAWGPNHGPAILLNRAARPGTPFGYRATLAHELCHLLCDRATALPLVEVLGGQVPKHPEQRANAFAAEFLLPQKEAAERVRHASSVVEAAAELSRTYQVSRELTFRQITNSSLELNAQDRLALDQWKSARAE